MVFSSVLFKKERRLLEAGLECSSPVLMSCEEARGWDGVVLRESKRKELEVGPVTTRIVRGFWPIYDVEKLKFLNWVSEAWSVCWKHREKVQLVAGLHNFLGIRESKSLGVTT